MIYFLYKVIKPSKEILLNFDKIVHPYFQKQNKIEESNLQLSSLRDWLLPMLMNGQVSVGDKNESIEKKKQNILNSINRINGYSDREESLGMVAEGGEKYGK